MLIAVAFVYWLLFRTTTGFEFRAVGSNPDAAKYAGVNVAWTTVAVMAVAGGLAGLAGAYMTMSLVPGWHANNTFIVQGWIAVALVIFGQWKPGRTMFGAYMMAFIFRLALDLQGPKEFFGVPNIFYEYQPSTFFLNMAPYLMVILVLVFSASEANRKRIGAPAAFHVERLRQRIEELEGLASEVQGTTHLALRRVIGISHGIGGNVDDYDNPDNSYLNRVLASRRGIPISLSILWMEVGRRAGLGDTSLRTTRSLKVCSLAAYALLGVIAIRPLLHSDFRLRTDPPITTTHFHFGDYSL